ncbi:MAG: rhodanese-like domain-containing protein [Flavobacteriales bacterium]|nr:rhodanese-like domain-containing protein [Flavobacteriales bacterium]
MEQITAAELQAMRAKGDPFQLIDVREPYEAERCSLGGTLIPMGEITQRLDEIRRDVPVVFHCRSGKRSAAVVQALEERYGFDGLLDLKGGILAYAEDVDPELNCD